MPVINEDIGPDGKTRLNVLVKVQLFISLINFILKFATFF